MQKPTQANRKIDIGTATGKSRPTVPIIGPVCGADTRPKVSVVTACYNALEPLKVTVSSVADQSFGDVEHVIIDGASSDGTPEYLETLGASVVWKSEPDAGIADAMNKGVALATGEWIIVLHAGDTLANNHSLSELDKYWDRQADIITCGIIHGSSGKYRTLVFGSPRRRLIFKTILHQGLLCRRSIFEHIGGFDQCFRVAMDYEFFLRARKTGCRFLPTRITLSRMDDTGVSSLTDWPSLRMRFAEEKRAQMLHCQSWWLGFVYAVYWPLYLTYRRLRSTMTGG